MVAQLDDAYKQLGKARSARRIASWALFEGRPHTTKGQSLNPAIFALLKTMGALPGQPSLDRPIFIVGLGRSGTTILGKLFSAHRDVGFLNEPKAIWSLIDPRTDVCADYVKSGGEFKLDASDVTYNMPNRAKRYFARYLSLVRATRLVDKYPELVFRLDYVRTLFPASKLVFITRNGRDACQSITQWSVRKGRETSVDTEDWWGRNNIKWHYLKAQLLAADARYHDLAAIDDADLQEVDRAAIEWAVTTEAGLDWQSQHPDEMIRVVYEDLAADPQTVLPTLFQACELPASDSALQYACEVLSAPPERDEPQLHPTVSEHFTRVMVKAGYQ